MITKTQDVAIQILNVFEELLNEHNLTIDSIDRKEAIEEDETDIAAIYGEEYFSLENKVLQILNDNAPSLEDVNKVYELVNVNPEIDEPDSLGYYRTYDEASLDSLRYAIERMDASEPDQHEEFFFRLNDQRIRTHSFTNVKGIELSEIKNALRTFNVTNGEMVNPMFDVLKNTSE
jgi:hypothetical protein